MAKVQPAVLNIKFQIGQGNTRFVDLSQAASIVNRRFYRQGLNWAVAGFTVTTAANQFGDITISKIPQTWCASNSWHKSYAAWNKQQIDALKDAGALSTRARYRDFKIHASALHENTGFAANATPVDVTGAAFSLGEWQPSQVVIPNTAGVVGDTDEFHLHMVGADIPTSFGMISNYSVSRAVPQSPAPDNLNPESGFLSEMFNVGMDDSEIVQNATDTNDELPYDQDHYPGGGTNAPQLEVVHETTLVASNWNSTSRKLSGTNVPCGLLEIINGVDGPIDFFVHLVPGEHRGYMCEPMQDM